MELLECLINKTKDEQCSSSPNERSQKKKRAGAFTESGVLSFRERRCAFSLDFQPF